MLSVAVPTIQSSCKQKVSDMGKTVLVIGATGGLGGAVAQAFLAQGWQVRAMARRPPELGQLPAAQAGLASVEWWVGDAMNAADVVRAAQGVDCIFHGANPPGYVRWRELALPMLASSIEAARVSGARLIFPGNVYNYGPDAWPLVSEQSPQNPTTRKGAIRVEMEQMLRDAARRHGVRSLVLRAGDFYGGHAPSSWFSTLMVKPGQRLRSVVYPGEPEVGHAWAYLPDLARTVVRLAELQEGLPAFDAYHFGGHWTARGIEMAESIRRAAGKPAMRIKSVPWWLINLASPLVALLRELIEMRYLWKVPVQLDNRKLLSLIGTEPHTPLDVAVRRSLAELGCLDALGSVSTQGA
jgi:nucleoside-diphosphate-sugar epimerase